MRIDIDDLRRDCYGKWAGIYAHFGIEVGTGKHGPCPACPDHGEDRFRCDGLERDGNYFCNQCGPGQGFSLLMKVKGWTFPTCIREVAKVINMVEKVESTEKLVDPAIALRQLYTSSSPLHPSDQAAKYLRGRKLVLTPNNIRFCPSCYESDTKTRIPAMLAVFQNHEGESISIHRTYLNGIQKAKVPAPKKMMSPKKPLAGGAVRLFDPNDQLYRSGKLGIAEGIENAMAAAQIFQIATWAALSTSLMEAFLPPPDIKEIIIFGDNDANFAGQKAAYVLANKLFLKDYLVEVKIPNKGDWNEEL